MASSAARRRDRVATAGAAAPAAVVPVGVVGPGEHRAGAEQAGTPNTRATTPRCSGRGMPRPAAADPRSPPVTAPMLQTPWKALRIERP